MSNPYVYTLVHWLVTGAAMLVLMLVVYAFLRALKARRATAIGYALILPWVLGFLIWQVYPFVYSLYLAFTEYDVLTPPKWVGLANFERMFTRDIRFWPSVRLTVLYSVISVPLGMIGALGTATLLAQDVKGVGFWRTLYYVPAVLPAAATALLWRWMFARQGLINTLLTPIYRLLGTEPLSWFSDERLVLPSFIIMSFWGVFGANTVILLAALKNVPKELKEAARVDGAGPWTVFSRITVPMISPALFYVLIMGVIGAMQNFTAPLFITTPGGAGTFLNVYVYQQGFTQFKMGYASAVGWFLMVLILLLTALVWKWSAAYVYYEGEMRRS
ncbi:multiple sugar transport system permease protein [Symbiobacterium terraclitae]|uniref:Multiple sugar transport system permease protein n=1 Tax=Symbiobacterium terraclitae TaxID=557451 RepID=A0ABS4JUI4_9FIRM|nr:multiple sugar transport system permease protein [Symbiobacterium terraclitae]